MFRRLIAAFNSYKETDFFVPLDVRDFTNAGFWFYGCNQESKFTRCLFTITLFRTARFHIKHIYNPGNTKRNIYDTMVVCQEASLNLLTGKVVYRNRKYIDELYFTRSYNGPYGDVKPFPLLKKGVFKGESIESKKQPRFGGKFYEDTLI